MWRNGYNPYVSTAESLHFFNLIDETAIVEVFHVGREFEDRHFLDNCDIKQSVIGDGVGHRHHAAAVESAIAKGKVSNAVVKDQIIIHGELDMCDFVGQNAFDQAD